MGSLNRVMLIGNLGKDAELRTTPRGDDALTFSMACTETWTDRDGQRQEKTEWVRCVLWGKRASALAEYLVKGKQIFAEGKLTTRQWEANGQKRYMTEVNVRNLVLLGGGGGSGGARRSRRRDEDEAEGREIEQEPMAPVAEPVDIPIEDDIPF